MGNSCLDCPRTITLQALPLFHRSGTPLGVEQQRDLRMYSIQDGVRSSSRRKHELQSFPGRSFMGAQGVALLFIQWLNIVHI
jgi:hypothetical protein